MCAPPPGAHNHPPIAKTHLRRAPPAECRAPRPRNVRPCLRGRDEHARQTPRARGEGPRPRREARAAAESPPLTLNAFSQRHLCALSVLRAESSAQCPSLIEWTSRSPFCRVKPAIFRLFLGPSGRPARRVGPPFYVWPRRPCPCPHHRWRRRAVPAAASRPTAAAAAACWRGGARFPTARPPLADRRETM